MATKEKEKAPMTLSFPTEKIKEMKFKAIEENTTVSDLLVKAFEQYTPEEDQNGTRE